MKFPVGTPLKRDFPIRAPSYDDSAGELQYHPELKDTAISRRSVSSRIWDMGNKTYYIYILFINSMLGGWAPLSGFLTHNDNISKTKCTFHGPTLPWQVVAASSQVWSLVNTWNLLGADLKIWYTLSYSYFNRENDDDKPQDSSWYHIIYYTIPFFLKYGSLLLAANMNCHTASYHCLLLRKILCNPLTCWRTLMIEQQIYVYIYNYIYICSCTTFSRNRLNGSQFHALFGRHVPVSSSCKVPGRPSYPFSAAPFIADHIP
jgi:hypothetical protein